MARALWHTPHTRVIDSMEIRYSIRASGALSLVLLGCLGIAPAVAKADVYYDVNAVVGNIAYGGPVGQYTGLTVTGTLDLTTIIKDFGTGSGANAASIKVQGDPNLFTGVLDCKIYTCASIFNSGFTEFGALNIGNPFTFTGSALGAGSYIALTNPLGSGPAEVAYDLSGTVSPAGGVITSNSPAPEPGFFGVLAVCLSGVFVAARKRRLS